MRETEENLDEADAGSNDAGESAEGTEPSGLPPLVSLVSPLDNAVVQGKEVLVSASASDPDGTVTSVEFTLPDCTLPNAKITHVVTTPPYEWLWDSTQTVDGNYGIMVTATDNLGNRQNVVAKISTNNGIQIMPTVTIVDPKQGGTLVLSGQNLPATAEISFGCNAHDALVDYVTFCACNNCDINPTFAVRVEEGPPWQASLSIGDYHGDCTIQAVAKIRPPGPPESEKATITVKLAE